MNYPPMDLTDFKINMTLLCLMLFKKRNTGENHKQFPYKAVNRVKENRFSTLENKMLIWDETYDQRLILRYRARKFGEDVADMLERETGLMPEYCSILARKKECPVPKDEKEKQKELDKKNGIKTKKEKDLSLSKDIQIICLFLAANAETREKKNGEIIRIAGHYYPEDNLLGLQNRNYIQLEDQRGGYVFLTPEGLQSAKRLREAYFGGDHETYGHDEDV